MSGHVLLNLLDELRKSDKMRGLPSNLLLFCNDFNKFNKTGARMKFSIYHMTIKLIKIRIFGVKTSRSCQIVVYRFYCIALYQSQTRRHVINVLSYR